MCHRETHLLAKLDHGADDRFQFEWPLRFDVLKHRRFVMADLSCSPDPLLDCYAQIDSQFLRHRLGFGHHLDCQSARLRALDNLYKRCAGQCAYGVERDAAHKLHPYLVTDVGSTRTAEPGSDDCFCYCSATLAL